MIQTGFFVCTLPRLLLALLRGRRQIPDVQFFLQQLHFDRIYQQNIFAHIYSQVPAYKADGWEPHNGSPAQASPVALFQTSACDTAYIVSSRLRYTWHRIRAVPVVFLPPSGSHITDRLDPFLEGPFFQYCFFTCARILPHDVSALLSQKYRSYAQKSIC